MVWVTLSACQTGLADAGLSAAAVQPFAIEGLVGLLADLREDRLLMA